LKCTGFKKEALQQIWFDISFNKDILVDTTFKDNHNDELFLLNLSNGELIRYINEMQKSKIDDIFFYLNAVDVLKRFQKVLYSLELQKYTLNDIRRTFGSYWVVRVSQIQFIKFMRHMSIGTTLRYYNSIDILSINSG